MKNLLARCDCIFGANGANMHGTLRCEISGYSIKKSIIDIISINILEGKKGNMFSGNILPKLS